MWSWVDAHFAFVLWTIRLIDHKLWTIDLEPFKGENYYILTSLKYFSYFWSGFSRFCWWRPQSLCWWIRNSSCVGFQLFLSSNYLFPNQTIYSDGSHPKVNYLFNIGAVITSASIAIKTILVFFACSLENPWLDKTGPYSHFEILCVQTEMG